MFTKREALVVFSSVYGASSAGDSAFMLVSGITSNTEICVTANGGAVSLEPCMQALAGGEGRELWQYTAGGALQNVGSGQCLGNSGETVVMIDCGGAGAWNALADGQLQHDGKCLSQKGAAAGQIDFAQSPSTSGDTVTVDLGGLRAIKEIDIDWENAPKAFAIQTSSDGSSWSEVYSTTSNIVQQTQVGQFGGLASQVRVVVRKGAFEIKGFHVYAPGTEAVLEDCKHAGRSGDARDKYFTEAVSSFDPAPAQALKAEIPALVEAMASLSGTVSDLADVMPGLEKCGKQVSFASVRPVSMLAVREPRAMAPEAKRAAELLAAARQVVVAVQKSLQ